jgi:hypothetical protein
MTTYYAAVEGDPLDSGEGSYVYGTGKTVGSIEDQHGTSRNMVFIEDKGYCACPGNLGMGIVKSLRSRLSLSAPGAGCT